MTWLQAFAAAIVTLWAMGLCYRAGFVQGVNRMGEAALKALADEQKRLRELVKARDGK